MKIHKIFTALSLGLAMAFASCQGPVGALYEGGTEDVSFASSSMIIDIASGDDEVIKVPIYRGNKDGEFSLQLEFDSIESATSRVFTLESDEIMFADGENVAYAELSYDFEDLAFGKDYYMDLKFVRRNNLSPSGIRNIQIELAREFATDTLGTGLFVSELFGGPYKPKVDKAREANVYVFKGIFDKDYDLILVLNEDETKMVSFGPYATGYVDADHGMVWVRGLSYEKSGKDFIIKCQYYAQGGGSFGDFEERFTLP